MQTKIKREKIQVDITTDLAAIKSIIKEYCEQLYSHKFNNSEEIHQLLENHTIPDQSDEMDDLNSPIAIQEIEFVV